ncbi:MAG TPA: hypothetical protein VKB88_37735 [Bryobacteraceae bacterium]|nr:hypothetical protein [Bryobacteraceae bacterium]
MKDAAGTIAEEGKLRATREVLRQWAGKRTEPWHGAMEATLFSGWIYDTLKPLAAELQMGHPAMMKAIGASKKKNDIHDKDLSKENTHLPGLIGRISGEATVAGLTVCTDLPNWIR